MVEIGFASRVHVDSGPVKVDHPCTYLRGGSTGAYTAMYESAINPGRTNVSTLHPCFLFVLIQHVDIINTSVKK
ncbi:hypothetical protein KUCAC02_010587, partial [Chaenocephalus aceratus]